MATTHDKKMGNLPAEVRLERDVRQKFVAMMGRTKDRAIYNVAGDVTHPTRVLARLLRKARAKRVPHEQAKDVVREIDRYVDRLYGKHITGEFKPAAGLLLATALALTIALVACQSSTAPATACPETVMDTSSVKGWTITIIPPQSTTCKLLTKRP